MRLDRLFAAALLLGLTAACAGPGSRIKDHQAAFDSYPPPVQEKIRAGQADVGFTKEQAAMAMGRPDRIFTRKTAASEREVWVYGIGSGGGSGPRFSVGVGFGFAPAPGFYGGDVAVDPDWNQGETIRLVFEDGKVASVEKRPG